jgi:hypothetical protein
VEIFPPKLACAEGEFIGKIFNKLNFHHTDQHPGNSAFSQTTLYFPETFFQKCPIFRGKLSKNIQGKYSIPKKYLRSMGHFLTDYITWHQWQKTPRTYGFFLHELKKTFTTGCWKISQYFHNHLCCINKKISTGHNTSFTIHCLHIILYTII